MWVEELAKENPNMIKILNIGEVLTISETIST